MAITWNRKLPTVAMVNNPALVYLETDNHPYDTGSKYQYHLDNLLYPAHNATMRFSFNGTAVLFTFKNTPDASGTQIKVRTTEIYLDYLNVLRNSIIQNYDIANNYNVEIFNDGTLHIRFTALNNGDEWEITFTESGSNFTFTEIIIGTDDEYYDNFQLMCQVWKGDSGSSTDVLLGEDRATPDANGECVFDIAKYLQPEIETSFTWPEETAVYQHVLTNAFFQYFIRFAEVKGIPPVVQAITTQVNLYALTGKKPDWKFDEDYRTLVDESAWDSTTRFSYNKERSFLTNQPAFKRIGQHQPEKLFFINWYSETSLDIRYTVYFTDGTSFQNGVTFGSSEYWLHELSIGPDWLNIYTIDVAKTVSHYTIVLVDSSGAPTERSEVQTYVIDYGPYKNERYFLFKNQRGGFDTVCFRGLRQRGLAIQADSIVSADGIGNPFTRLKRTRHSINSSSPIKIASGPLDELELDHYKEILLSDEIYMVVDGNLHNCAIVTNSVDDLKTDNQYTYNLNIEVLTDYVDAVSQSTFDDSLEETFIQPVTPQID